MNGPRESALNESQRHRLIVTCQYVDRLLGDLERAFIEAQSNSPFVRYANDLAPAEQRLVQDCRIVTSRRCSWTRARR